MLFVVNPLLLDSRFEEFVNTCHLLGHECISSSENPTNIFAEEAANFNKIIDKSDAALYLVSINEALSTPDWSAPGILYDIPYYEYSWLLGRIPSKLFNTESILIPYGALIHLYQGMNYSPVFVRSNSGDKTIPGQIIDSVDDIKALNVLPETLVVVSSYRDISQYDEWRVWVTPNGNPICGTRYKKNGSVSTDNMDIPRAVMLFAQLVEQELKCPIAHTIDISIPSTNHSYDMNDLSVIEINSYSCSALYGINFRKWISETYEWIKNE